MDASSLMNLVRRSKPVNMRINEANSRGGRLRLKMRLHADEQAIGIDLLLSGQWKDDEKAGNDDHGNSSRPSHTHLVTKPSSREYGPAPPAARQWQRATIRAPCPCKSFNAPTGTALPTNSVICFASRRTAARRELLFTIDLVGGPIARRIAVGVVQTQVCRDQK